MGIMDSASYYLGRGIDSADKATRGLKIQTEITRLESQKKGGFGSLCDKGLA